MSRPAIPNKPPTSPPPCPACGRGATRLLWARFANGTRHIREECRKCGRFLRWAPQHEYVCGWADIDTSAATRAALAELIGGPA